MFSPDILDIFMRFSVALMLGVALGLQREFRGKAAGMRTYGLVTLGACLFTYISVFGFAETGGSDPARVAANIVVGIGFLGAGLIIFRPEQQHIEGLTTAAGMWVAAAVGMAVGLAMYQEAIVVTLLTLFTLEVLAKIELTHFKQKK
jgi:putative Mg2+ transporter-C (MgtC) family protein